MLNFEVLPHPLARLQASEASMDVPSTMLEMRSSREVRGQVETHLFPNGVFTLSRISAVVCRHDAVRRAHSSHYRTGHHFRHTESQKISIAASIWRPLVSGVVALMALTGWHVGSDE
jgi:hypothetical protein